MSATGTGGRQGKYRIYKLRGQHQLRWTSVVTVDGATDDVRQSTDVPNSLNAAEKSRTYSPLRGDGPRRGSIRGGHSRQLWNVNQTIRSKNEADLRRDRLRQSRRTQLMWSIASQPPRYLVSQLGRAHENQPPRIRPVLILTAATSPAILMAIVALPLNGWGVLAAAFANGLI
jgi:hypothetical protein